MRIPNGYRELEKGEEILSTDCYVGRDYYAGVTGAWAAPVEVHTQTWWRAGDKYGYRNTCGGPNAPGWAVVRRIADWRSIGDTRGLSDYGPILWWDGINMKLANINPSNKTTHWMPAPLPPVKPDITIRLNAQHDVVVKGDKSGLLIGCAKDSFVEKSKVQQILNALS